MNERLEAIKSSILDSLDKAKTALNNKEVAVESLKVSEIPGYIRQIELNKIKLTVNCSEFESGTVKATKDGKERTGTVQDGQCIIMLPSTGTWHVEHDLGDYVEVEINGDTSAELVKKKVTFSEGECSEEKIIIHVDSVTGNNSNDNFIRVKKNGVVIEVQAQLKGSDIEITNFEYEEDATYTVEYVIKDEVRGSVEVEISTIPNNLAGSSGKLFDGIEGVSKDIFGAYTNLPTHIVFTDQKAPLDAKVSYWTENGKNGIARWRDTNTDTLYISTQEEGKKILMPESCRGLFYGATEYSDFAGGNSNVKTIDLTNADFSNTTDMYGMFMSQKVLEEITFGDFNTSKVTNMSRMFYGIQINSLDLSCFDTTLVTDMSRMFYENKIETLDLRSFGISNVTNMDNMFYNYKGPLKTIYAKEWNSTKNSNLHSNNMFSFCESLPNYSSSKTDISMAKWKENGGYFTNPAEKG